MRPTNLILWWIGLAALPMRKHESFPYTSLFLDHTKCSDISYHEKFVVFLASERMRFEKVAARR